MTESKFPRSSVSATSLPPCLLSYTSAPSSWNNGLNLTQTTSTSPSVIIPRTKPGSFYTHKDPCRQRLTLHGRSLTTPYAESRRRRAPPLPAPAARQVLATEPIRAHSLFAKYSKHTSQLSLRQKHTFFRLPVAPRKGLEICRYLIRLGACLSSCDLLWEWSCTGPFDHRETHLPGSRALEADSIILPLPRKRITNLHETISEVAAPAMVSRLICVDRYTSKNVDLALQVANVDLPHNKCNRPSRRFHSAPPYRAWGQDP
ncbi:hypothetical protein B0H15DRAFT_28152 [Mycena belliarum]|uniref:Uncharacterized protein n=1 Tax=Mycena belliarum TaxID=1033014 RepID=A0AAD6UJQ5_9AGAR|nr:hypothetical protein B0H15DRAFT_28152 [Mycena belliae]